MPHTPLVGSEKDSHAMFVLLKKYMSHVGELEGTDFVIGETRPPEFTELEWALLRALSAEASADAKAAEAKAAKAE